MYDLNGFTKVTLTYNTVKILLEQWSSVIVAHLSVVVVIMSNPLDGLNVVPYCSTEIVRAHVLVFTNTERRLKFIFHYIKHVIYSIFQAKIV